MNGALEASCIKFRAGNQLLPCYLTNKSSDIGVGALGTYYVGRHEDLKGYELYT